MTAQNYSQPMKANPIIENQGAAVSVGSDALVRHEYHCAMCGTQLHEIGLGCLACEQCGTQFVPTIDQDDDSIRSITWKLPNDEDETRPPNH